MSEHTIRSWKQRKITEDYGDVQQPSPLSIEQQQMIVDLIMEKIVVNGPSTQTINQMRDNIRTEMLRQIGTINIIPHPAAIDELIDNIIGRYNNAKVPDGEAVGLISPTSIASASTQATMKSFSLASGASAVVEGGLTGLTTLIYTRLTRKNDSRVIIHFNTAVDKIDVISMRRMFIETNVKELIVSSRIGKLSNIIGSYYEGQLERFWWHNLQGNDPDKVELLNQVNGDSYVLRLNLNHNLMYTHRIKPSDVAHAIQSVKGKAVSCIPSPFTEGIVDIIILPNNITNVPKENYEQIYYLNKNVLAGMQSIKLKGIEGIKNLFPKTYPINDVISDESKLSENEWIISVGKKSHSVFEGIFIPYHRLEQLFIEHSIEIIQRTHNKHNNIVTGYHLRCEKSPSEYLRGLIYTYAITDGSNYDAIIRIPWVDPLRTIPNNIFEICNKIGVEASREYFQYEFVLVLKSMDSDDINSRHITLTTDMIYVQGKPSGATYIGNIVRGQGPCTQAASERGGDAMIKAAINSVREKARATTPSILLGGYAEIGREALIAKTGLKSLSILKSRLEDVMNRKAAISRETRGTRGVMDNFNQSIRNMLTYGRLTSPDTPSTDLTITAPPSPTLSIEIVDGNNPQFDYLPISTSYMLDKTLSLFPTTFQAQPPTVNVAQVTQMSLPTTDMNVLPTLTYYQKLFDFPTGMAEMYDNKIVMDILSKYMPMVQHKTVEIALPVPIHDINIYSRKLVETQQTVVVDVPVDKLRNIDHLKMVVHIPHDASILYSTVMNNKISLSQTIDMYYNMLKPTKTYSFA